MNKLRELRDTKRHSINHMATGEFIKVVKVSSEPDDELSKNTIEYTKRTWNGMIQRCFNKKNSGYKDYGARGITVCDRWRYSFKNFMQDMGPRPDSLQLDRINNDGNYEPGNCRWTDCSTNTNNRRKYIFSSKIRYDNCKNKYIAQIVSKNFDLPIFLEHESYENLFKVMTEFLQNNRNSL